MALNDYFNVPNTPKSGGGSTPNLPGPASSGLNNYFNVPSANTKGGALPVDEVKPVAGTYNVDKDGSFKDSAGNTFSVSQPKPAGDGSVISKGEKAPAEQPSLLEKVGRAILPESLQNAFGIAPESESAQNVRLTGTAATIEEANKNPDKIDPLQYLQRGISFGNNLDPTNAVKGYKSDVSVTDLPEPTTVPQKVAQAIGGIITMTLAQPLIEAGVGSLIGSSATGAKFLEGLKTATEANPWTIGYGAKILESAGTGGLFGLITNNKQSVAQNVLQTAGTFAAFTALAYPVAQFFKPIIQQVGQSTNIQNENLKNILNDPAVTQPTIQKELWFRNPKDPSQLLKVTANGMEFKVADTSPVAPEDANALSVNGQKVKNVFVMTDADIQAFKEKPSVYQNLKNWVAGKGAKDVPFSVTDTMPKDTIPVDANAVETPHDKAYKASVTDLENTKPSEVRDNLSKLDDQLTTTRNMGLDDTAQIAKINASRDAFNAYTSAHKEIIASVPSGRGSPTLELSVVPFDDGKYVYRVEVNAGNSGMSSPFSTTAYPTREAAINAGTKDIQKWVANEKTGATPAGLKDIAKIEKSLAKVASNSPKNTENTPAISGKEPLVKSDIQAGEQDKIYYHGTTKENAKAILKGGFNTDTVALTPDLAEAKEYGDTVIQVRVKNNASEVNPNSREPLYSPKDIRVVGKATPDGKNVLPSTKGTQKEIVKEAVKGEAKSIKQVAQETKILEPNVRRILGVGAKDGTFERVDNGVYVLKNAGKEIAYVEANDALTALTRLATEGKIYHSVILDPAYFSRALIGGNRGIKEWGFIMPDEFAKVMKQIGNLVNDKAQVYLMLSGARTAQPDMGKYVKGATDAGFKVVGEGSYTKLDKSGKPVTNVRGVEAAGERLILMSKSGNVAKGEIPVNLNFRFVRPSIAKSYQTEKPAELMKALIEQATLKGESVLDPFAGSGVSGAEAIKSERVPTLIEKKPEVVENVIKPRLKTAIEMREKGIKVPENLPKPPPEKYPSTVQLNSGLDPGLDKTLKEDIIPKAKGLFQGGKNIFKEVATLFNPVGQAPKTGVDILMKNKGEFEKETFRTEQATKKIKTMWDKQPEAARLDFMAKVESGAPIPDNKPFSELAEMYRARLDNAYKAISAYKDVPFVENFFPHFWEKPDQISKDFLAKTFAKRPLQGSRSFLKHRVFDTIQEGIKAGYKPVSTNPEELTQIYEANVRKFVMAQQIKEDMLDKGFWKFVRQGAKAPEGFAKIEDSIAQIYYPKEVAKIMYGEKEGEGAVRAGEYYVQKDVARLINNYLSKDRLMDTSLGKGIMNVKNTLNAFQLGFSAFHLTMETLDTVTTKLSIGLSEVASGNVIKGLKDMVASPLAPYSFFRNGQKFFNNDPTMKDIEDAIFAGGASFREKQYYKNTVLDTFVKNVLGGNYLGALVRAPLAAVEATMRPLFSYYIPRLKVGAFRELYASELTRLSQDIQDGKITQAEVARNTWNNIDNRMGELNYDNLFWDRNLKSALMLTFRAVGWNLGTVRELGGGLMQDTPKEFKKLFTGNAKDFNFTPKMSYTLALFLLTGTLGAVYQYLHTGQKPQSVKDLYYPKNGAKDKSGEDYRVEFPTYLKDLYQYTHNPVQTVFNKTAPELSILINLLQNKDFYGDYIRNTNDNLGTQAKQTALFLATQLTPFTFQNLGQLNAGQAGTEQKVEAFFGIIKAPKEVIQSVYQKELYNLYREQVGETGARTPEQVEIADLKTQARDALKNGDYSVVQDMVKNKIITPAGARTFIKNARLTSDQRVFKYLSKQNKAQLKNSLPSDQ